MHALAMAATQQSDHNGMDISMTETGATVYVTDTAVEVTSCNYKVTSDNWLAEACGTLLLLLSSDLLTKNTNNRMLQSEDTLATNVYACQRSCKLHAAQHQVLTRNRANF